MQRINKTTVELTSAEQAADRTFNLWLDEGRDIPTAIRKTRRQHLGLDEAFWAWLAS